VYSNDYIKNDAVALLLGFLASSGARIYIYIYLFLEAFAATEFNDRIQLNFLG